MPKRKVKKACTSKDVPEKSQGSSLSNAWCGRVGLVDELCIIKVSSSKLLVLILCQHLPLKILQKTTEPCK